MNIIASEFVALDGVMEAREKWSVAYWNDQHQKYADRLLGQAAGLLLGRVTYEVFASSWPSRTGAFADRMNGLPKYVASKTLSKVEWQNSQLLGDDTPGAIAELKRQAGNSLMIYGSATLVRSLLQADLIDEYHLWICPLVLGGGKRLFDGAADRKFQAPTVTPLGSGVVVLAYHR